MTTPTDDLEPKACQETSPALDTPSESVPTDDHPVTEPPSTASRNRREALIEESRYWTRTVGLAAIATAIYALTKWDESRVPRSSRSAVDSRLGSPETTTRPSAPPSLDEALRQVRTGLEQRDVRALARLAAPQGVRVAPHPGGLAILQGETVDPSGLLESILTGSQPRLVGWRMHSPGIALLLTTGWSLQRFPLILSPPTIIATNLMVFWLVALAERWNWHALTVDHGTRITQLAGHFVWQPIPR